LALFAPMAMQAQASGCRADTLTARYPAAWIGQRVRQLLVRPENIAAPMSALRPVVDFVHVPTRSSVILHEAPIVVGAPLDSLVLQESVRRLRASGLFTDVRVTGTTCPGEGVDLTIETQDTWSLHGDLRLGRNQSRYRLADINTLGWGKSLGVQSDEVDDRRAFNVSWLDPSVAALPVRGAAVLRSYGDGRSWQWSLQSRPETVLDDWRAFLLSTQARRFGDDSARQTRTDIDRRSTQAIVGRRITTTPTGVWLALGGAEAERTRVSVQSLQTFPRPDVHREFTAPLLGIARQTLRYGAVDWLVPGQAPAEIPTGLDLEIVVSRGQELISGGSITHVDGWIGYTAMPTAGTLITGDAWAGGYWNGDSVSNGTTRLAVGMFSRANPGYWALRLVNERIYNPDPDVFALSTLDPLLRSLAPTARLSEWATSATLERAVPLYSSSGVWALDGALFATAGDRHNIASAATTPERNTRSLIIGFGLRRVLAQPTQAPIRIDFGRGIYRSSLIPDRWVFAVTAAPWQNDLRGRVGGREPR
jgi:hypothetical protein